MDGGRREGWRVAELKPRVSETGALGSSSQREPRPSLKLPILMWPEEYTRLLLLFSPPKPSSFYKGEYL